MGKRSQNSSPTTDRPKPAAAAKPSSTLIKQKVIAEKQHKLFACAVCKREYAVTIEHVFKHLKDDLQESRFHCLYPNCHYRTPFHSGMHRHLKGIHKTSGPNVILDRKNELTALFEATYKECFGVSKPTNNTAFRGRSLGSQSLCNSTQKPPPASSSRPMTRARGYSLGSVLRTTGGKSGAPIFKGRKVDNTTSATGMDQNLNSTPVPASLPYNSAKNIVKEEPADDYTVNKMRSLSMRPKVGKDSLVICGFCEKGVTCHLNHVYHHLSKDFQLHRFLCGFRGCTFGTSQLNCALTHQQKTHKSRSKKMVVDRTTALKAQVQKYSVQWLGLPKRVSAVAQNDKDDMEVKQQQGEEMEDGEEPADFNDDMPEDIGDGGALPHYINSGIDKEREGGHVVVTAPFVFSLVEGFLNGVMPSRATVLSILMQAKNLLEKEPNMVDIQLSERQELTICGDLHGQFLDLCEILARRGNPSDSKLFLFNGDFVDRGSQGVEVVLTILVNKLLFPNAVFLNRGNHESIGTNQNYGFETEVNEKYDAVTFYMFQSVFCALPICHRVDKRVFVCHGGLFKEEGVTFDGIQAINRFVQPPDCGIMCDLLWADPQNKWGSQPSSRGISHAFGPDITSKWCIANGIDYIIRSHEDSKRGWDMQEGGCCFTVFSASNYCGTGNRGAYAVITRQNPMPNIQSFALESEEMMEQLMDAGDEE